MTDTRKTRMLCFDCEALKALKAHGDEMCVLSCGHVRTLGLLPSVPGAISLEDVILNTPDAARLFPFVVDVGIEPEEREGWE
jgi:hypothetical protein